MLPFVRQLHRLFTPKQWRQYLLLQLLFIATAVLQVGGVASIAPFIALVTNPAIIHTNRVASYLYSTYGFANDVSFLVFFALMVMVLIVVSNLIAALASWLIFIFAQDLGVELQDSVYRSFVRKDFVFYSSSNSSHMITVLTDEVPRYVYNVVQPFMILASQLFVAAIIMAGLAYLDVRLSVVAFLVVGGAYAVVFGLLKRKLSVEGKNLWVFYKQKIKLLHESLGGIKEVRLLGKEGVYEGLFHANNESGARSAAFIGLAGDLPRFIIETTAFCALMLLSVYLLRTYGASTAVISTISLYAMAGYKLLPAAQQIYKSVSQVKSNGVGLEQFIDEVFDGRAHRRAGDVPVPVVPLGESVRLEHVSYSYPGAKTPALRDVSLEIKANTIVSFVGRSGAGKSTMAEIVLGMLTPSSGHLRTGKVEITTANIRGWQRHLGYVPQNIFIIDDTITANIAFGEAAGTIDVARVKKAAAMANIDTFVESLTAKYEFRVGERGALLSGGQRQRIGIARALYHNADVLVLDEATSALDSVTERDILQTIRELRASKTIVMIAHRLSTVKHSDQVVFLEDGSIAASGTFTELIAANAEFGEMVRSDLTVSDENAIVAT
jgi:ABC-type multidrug transport system fused ATPase/permease subunit